MHLHRGIQRGAAALAATLLGCGLLTATANAATFKVTTRSDPAATASSKCASTCSLRDAIIAADNAGGSSTITLPAGTYKLTIPSTAADDPTTGDLDVKNHANITIDGAGAATTIIDPTNIDRAFAVQEGSSLTINGVTITHGESSDAAPDKNSTSPGDGGDIYNDGALTVSHSALIDSTAYDYGGAIYSDANATATTITDSTVSHDSDYDYDGGAIAIMAGTLTLRGVTAHSDYAYDYGGVIYELESKSTPAAVTISDSSFSGNSADDPAGVAYFNTVGAISISGSTFTNNFAYNGGAIYIVDSGAVTISSSAFSYNSSGGEDDDNGGAIYASASGLLSVSDTSFTGNLAGGESDGGAIYAGSNDIAVTSSQFDANDSGDGGALYVDGTHEAGSSGGHDVANETITTSSFDGNTSDEGGAIYDAYGYLAVTNSTLDGNAAGNDGGGLYYTSNDGLTLTNDTIEGQSAENGGGIDFDVAASSGDPITLQNDTIAENTGYYGGGIYEARQINSISDTIIADNTGETRESTPAGGDCYGGTVDSGPHTTADGGHNIDSDGSCFGGDHATGDKTEVNPLLAGLADNGGPVWTDALLPGSPAIGAGASCASTDARGVHRGSHCDIGAFQTAATDLALAGTGPHTSSGLLNYRFTVTNHGPGADGAVTFTDKLPAGEKLQLVSSSKGSCSGTRTVTCSIGALDNGARATIRILVTTSKHGKLTDSAHVSGAFKDPHAKNNNASVKTKVV